MSIGQYPTDAAQSLQRLVDPRGAEPQHHQCNPPTGVMAGQTTYWSNGGEDEQGEG